MSKWDDFDFDDSYESICSARNTAPSEEEVFYDIAVWINNNFLVPMAQFAQLTDKIEILENQSRNYYNDHRR